MATSPDTEPTSLQRHCALKILKKNIPIDPICYLDIVHLFTFINIDIIDLSFCAKYQPLIENVKKNIENKSIQDIYNKETMITFFEKFDLTYILKMIETLDELPLEILPLITDKNHWEIISSKRKIPCEILKKFEDRISWNIYTKTEDNEIDALLEFKEKLDWHEISKRNIYRNTKEFIDLFINDIDYIAYIKNTYNLSEYILTKLIQEKKKIWKIISMHQVNIPESFLEKWKKNIIWKYIVGNFSKEFLYKFQDKLNFERLIQRGYYIEEDAILTISKTKPEILNTAIVNQSLSIKFLEEASEMFTENEWLKISEYQDITENFMEKYKNKLNWNLLAKYQDFSKEFIDEYIDHIDINDILCHRIESEDYLNKYLDKLSYKTIINQLNYNLNLTAFFRAKLLKILRNYYYNKIQEFQGFEELNLELRSTF